MAATKIAGETSVSTVPGVPPGTEAPPRNTAEHPGTLRNTPEHCGTPRNTAEHPGIPRNTAEHPGTGGKPGNAAISRTRGETNLKIKVCGLKHPENIEAVAGLNPGYAGFICYHKSARFIDALKPEHLSKLSPEITKTGVFVNETADNINQFINSYQFNAIQLHGDESPEFCALFKDRVEVLKAFGVHEEFDFSVLNDYKDQVDFFLFDTKTNLHGGSGNTFNWDLLSAYQLDVPFFLSGGLSLENLNEIKKISHPQFYGVDLNSRFENEPGLKDLDKLKQAFALINN